MYILYYYYHYSFYGIYHGTKEALNVYDKSLEDPVKTVAGVTVGALPFIKNPSFRKGLPFVGIMILMDQLHEYGILGKSSSSDSITHR